MTSSPPAKKIKTGQHASSTSQANIFSGFSVYIVEQCVGKVRCNILKNQVENRGGVVEKEFSPNTTHIFINKGLKKERLLKILKKSDLDQNVKVLLADWISACLVKGEIIDDNGYLPYRGDHTQGNVNWTKSFVCSRPSTSSGENFNKHITARLQLLLDEYTSTQDRWRAFGYKKAIASIAKYHKPLETYEEVLKLTSVGERLAKKVWEIIETGHLKRLDHIDPKVETSRLFSGVWGAGPKTAESWVARGFKSLEDLPEDELTFQQNIGVKHYHDINEKMLRSEVSEIEKLVRRYAEELLPGVLLVVCGSYRRGRPLCGDIDILVSHTDGKSQECFLSSLLNKLKEVNVITDDLITVDNESQRKYMGLCKLHEEGSKYRRIDFIAAPYSEWHCALLHFTGSAHFNRSIRLLAKKKGMSLSEHALRRNVVRGKTGEKINKGEIISVCSEADIFQYLELDYLEPTERDW